MVMLSCKLLIRCTLQIILQLLGIKSFVKRVSCFSPLKWHTMKSNANYIQNQLLYSCYMPALCKRIDAQSAVLKEWHTTRFKYHVILIFDTYSELYVCYVEYWKRLSDDIARKLLFLREDLWSLHISVGQLVWRVKLASPTGSRKFSDESLFDSSIAMLNF